MRALPAALARLLRHCSSALLAACFVVAAGSTSWAAGSQAESSQAESTARALSLGKLGAAAYEAGDHAAAIAHFDRAFELLPAPSLQLWAARSCAKLGRLVEAQQRYRQTLSLSSQVGDPAVQLEAQRAAKQELEQLVERTPRLSLELAEGERRELASTTTASDRAATEPDAAVPEPASAPAMTSGSSAKAWRTAGWMGVGAGGALLLTGIVTRSVAQSRYDALQRQPGCSRRQCGAEARDSVGRYHAMRTASLVTLLGGTVLAAAGAGALLLLPAAEDEGGLALSPAGLAWSGQF